MAFTKAGLWGPQAIIDSTGHPQPGATATLYLPDEVTLASLWTTSAKSVVMANPTQADIHANLHFYADPGQYRLKITVGAVVTWLDVEVPIDPGEAAQDQDVTAAIATAEAYADGIVAAALAAALAGSQPLDADLTAIAALSTTAYGRAFLALADAAAGRTALGLGTAATHAVGDFDAAGAAAAATAALVNGAPGALDTLNELATALADDASFATTITNALAAKSPILIPTAVKTGNYTAAATDYVLCDTSGGIFTVTLPTAPADKTSIAVDLVASGNTLTIARGGADVFQKAGGPTSLTMNTANRVLVLQYQSATAVWHVQDHLPAVINTKGDLLTYGTERARLAVGADGALLGADSTQATGLKWIPSGTYAPATGIAESAVSGLVTDLAAKTAAASSVPRHPARTLTRGALLLGNGTDGYNENHVQPEQIVRDLDGTYYLIYTGTGTTGFGVGMASASSPGGPYTDLGLIRVSVDAPYLIRQGTTWYMFGTQGQSTGLGINRLTASSITGPYTFVDTAIAVGTTGAWDVNRCLEPWIIKKPDNTYVMFYMGFDTGNAHEQVGMATATNLDGTWTKAAGNPVIPVGSAGALDEIIAADPFALYFNGTYYIFYTAGAAGAVTAGNYNIALATSTDLTTFTKRGEVFRRGTWPDGDASAVWRGSFFVHDDGTIYFPYNGRKGAANSPGTPRSQAYLATIDPASFVGGPRENPWRRVENNSTDKSLVRTTGTWANITVTTASGSSACFSATTNDKISFYFEGRKARWGAICRDSYGFADVYLDGTLMVTRDMYFNDPNGFPTIGYETADLPLGWHKLEIVVNGGKNASSSNTNVVVDFFEYLA